MFGAPGLTVESMSEPTERDRDERVSLDPLDPETALRALLAVKPEGEPEDANDDSEADRK
jgi:hypothetical protein